MSTYVIRWQTIILLIFLKYKSSKWIIVINMTKWIPICHGYYKIYSLKNIDKIAFCQFIKLNKNEVDR